MLHFAKTRMTYSFYIYDFQRYTDIVSDVPAVWMPLRELMIPLDGGSNPGMVISEIK